MFSLGQSMRLDQPAQASQPLTSGASYRYLRFSRWDSPQPSTPSSSQLSSDWTNSSLKAADQLSPGQHTPVFELRAIRLISPDTTRPAFWRFWPHECLNHLSPADSINVIQAAYWNPLIIHYRRGYWPQKNGVPQPEPANQSQPELARTGQSQPARASQSQPLLARASQSQLEPAGGSASQN